MPENNNFAHYHTLLQQHLSYVEDSSFSWQNVVAILIIRLTNTDSLNKDRDASHATQIQLTSEREETEYRKTEDFFPSLVMNRTFKSWRLKVPTRISNKNIGKLREESTEDLDGWQNDSVQIRRRLLNQSEQGGGNPTLQICYGSDLMPLRERLQVNDYIVFTKERGTTVYEAFGVKSSVNLGSGKKMFFSDKTENDKTVFELASIDHSSPADDTPRNKIYFGAPGTGKSHQLNDDAKTYFAEENTERITFYPNYSYAQFVGTYKPVTRNNGEIAYAYVPGPLMRQWIRAMQNPTIPVLLIVEELNRANAPAVFGDMFQLLDRKNGVSEYSVATSEDLRKYLQSIVSVDNHAGDDKSDWEWLPNNTPIDNIRLPANLFIWTTMNNADQGVFPLDTAFKRRWDNTYIGIDEKSDVIAECNFHFAKGLYSWNEFRMKINSLLTACRVNEDKLLGPFFLNPLGLTDEEFVSKFKGKVLMYLYEDAARQCRDRVFSEDENKKQRTYSEICSAFDKLGAGVFKEIVLPPISLDTEPITKTEQTNE